MTAPDSEAEIEAHINELTAARDGERPFVSLIVRYGGREARLQIESDAALIEQTALPEAVRTELGALIDALETIAEGATAIAVRLGPVKAA